MMKTTTRPAMLTASVARGNLPEDIPEFRHAIAAIDRLGELYEGLSAIRATNDSRVTPEARAERYAQQHQAALAMKASILNNARHDLNSRRERLRNVAIERSGLNGTYPQGEEVRRALRDLPPKERDKAINEAVDNGDAWIVGSVVRFPDLLTGKLSLSKAQLTDLFITRASPELPGELNAIDTAFQHLSLAEQTFEREAERMRDIEAENRANEDRKAVEEAEAKLSKALGMDSKSTARTSASNPN